MLFLAALGLFGSLWGCAGEISRVVLQVPELAPLPGPPGSPRIAVRPLDDLRDPEVLKAREGWFLEYLPDQALEPGIVPCVTDAIVQHLRASGSFERVLALGPDEGVAELPHRPRDPLPADFLLEGEVLAFYVERSTLTHPFFSLIATPLGFPLAALSGLKLLPTPITPILPVDYRANLAINLRLRNVQMNAVVWEGTLEGVSGFRETAAADFFKGKEELMRDAGSSALRTVMEKLARQFPPSEWFTARWPKRRSSGN